MKYVITIICLIFTMNCASFSKKPVPAPDPGPTQEEALQQLELKQNTKQVEEWWEEERAKVAAYFYLNLGIVVDLTLEKVHFFNDYDLGMLEIKLSFADKSINCYIILTPTSEGWAFGQMVIRKPTQLVPPSVIEQGNDHDKQL